MYIEHFRFVNLNRILSFVDAVHAVHTAIQTLLDHTLADAEPSDFVN